jgi:Vacuolar membrane-associated protein Iml1
MFTFRSRSARIFWLVQISAELWEYAPPYTRGAHDESSCELYFDRWITFVRELFQKWKAVEASHSLTIVFFSRTYLTAPVGVPSIATERDAYGRAYEDRYRMVVENETTADWDRLVPRLKEAFLVSLPKYILGVQSSLLTTSLER